jgi:hypothetical protein
MLILVAMIAAIPLAWYVGVFRRNGIAGPNRVPSTASLWPLVIALSIAAVCWIGTQTLYVGVRAYEFAQRHRAENPLSTDVLRRTVFTSLARKAAER